MLNSLNPYIRISIFIFLLSAPFQSGWTGGGEPTLIGWNNLGMHCMDDDYSVFTILPPYNTIDAQYIDASGNLITSDSGITITYEAIADPDGSINSSSIGKSNFWQFAEPAFGAAVSQEWGLAGTRMPGPANTPQSMTWNGTMRWFEAEGVPITPVDDAGHGNPYPLFRLVARDSNGALLAETRIVLPVSGEMDCRACHASGSGPAARPMAGWIHDADDKRDYRLNILRLHDEHHLGDPRYTAALQSNGWPSSGLLDAVVNEQKPILCAKCHLSEALPGTGVEGIPPLTQAVHSKHAWVVNPANGLLLNDTANRSGCYTCHPGSETRCLRGAMGSAVEPDGSMSMQCQSCHGLMSNVGSGNRTGWFDEPTCQQCHTGTATQNNGQIRYTSVFENDGSVRIPASSLFATNANTPVAGVSLYRFSKGHGGLQCSACHGSTHAEFPASHRNDNLQSIDLQGHAGVVADCLACHATMPGTVTGGPHGMHPVGTQWIRNHEEYGKSANCKACHGSDYRGTVLSRMFADRDLVVRDDGVTRNVHLQHQQTVSCFICHKREDDGRIGGLFTNNHAPVASNALLTTDMDSPAGLTLPSTDADNDQQTFRLVQQPQHGYVVFNGSSATYHPESGYLGPDSFTFAANDGLVESNRGIVSISVGSGAAFLDKDHDGLFDLLEYALGLNPDFPTIYSQPKVEVIGGSRFLQMVLPRGVVPPDAHVTIEVSADLKVWTPATDVSVDSTELRARDPIPVHQGSPRFIRAHVTRL